LVVDDHFVGGGEFGAVVAAVVEGGLMDAPLLHIPIVLRIEVFTVDGFHGYGVFHHKVFSERA
jgi:hypothetical protein